MAGTGNGYMTARQRFVSQTTSGRWILTVLAGGAFFMFCMAVSFVIGKNVETLKAETIVAMFGSLLLVIQGVYKDYFNRDRNGKHPDENGATPKPPPGDDGQG